MKIEKISDTQVKFLLMQTDLEERDIKISELSHSSDKTHQLFKEIIQLAQDEGTFSSESTPYLIEAMRVGVDSLAVMVTKIDADDLERRYNLSPAAVERCRYKRSEYINQPGTTGEDSQGLFSFIDLDTAAAAALAIGAFDGESQLHKLSGQYYLWLSDEHSDSATVDIEAILLEFGQKHVSNNLSKQYLIEHGELVIAEDAVGKLSLI